MESRKMKRIVLSEANLEDNLRIASYLLEKGFNLTLITDDLRITGSYYDQLPTEHKNRCFVIYIDFSNELRIYDAIDSIKDKMEGLDVFINGLTGINESELLKQSPDTFGRGICADFNKLFLLNREMVRCMVRQKCGNIIFLMIDDILYNADYPVSPVGNQGRISLMKSMAKELTPFNIKVNSLAFGIHDRGFENTEKRAVQKKLEFCALKPPIPKWPDLLPALDALIYPAFQYMTGQNYSAAIGTGNT